MKSSYYEGEVITLLKPKVELHKQYYTHSIIKETILTKYIHFHTIMYKNVATSIHQLFVYHAYKQVLNSSIHFLKEE